MKAVHYMNYKSRTSIRKDDKLAYMIEYLVYFLNFFFSVYTVEKLREMLDNASTDFDALVSLIREVEHSSPVVPD